MKIKHLAIGLIAATTLYSCGGGEAPTTETTEVVEVIETEVVEEVTGDVYAINTEESTIGWYGNKAIVEGEHNGNVSLKSGELVLTEGVVVGGSFVVDMNTITNEDLEDEEMNAKLVGHLKADDFFGVEANPEASLVIKSVDGENITADVTIKGVTKEVTFPASVTEEEGVVTAEAEIAINRTEFGIKYGSKNFFADLVDEYVISDGIKLTVALTATK